MKKFIILTVFLVIWLVGFFAWNMGSMKKKNPGEEGASVVQDSARHFSISMPKKPDTHISMRVDTAGVTKDELFYCQNEHADTIVSLAVASTEEKNPVVKNKVLQILQNNLLSSEGLQINGFVPSGSDTVLLRHLEKRGSMYFLYITARSNNAVFLYREMNKDLSALKKSATARSFSVRYPS